VLVVDFKFANATIRCSAINIQQQCFSTYGSQSKFGWSRYYEWVAKHFFVSHATLISVLKADFFFVNVITFCDIGATSACPSFYIKNYINNRLPTLPGSQRKIIGSAKYNCFFFNEVTARIAKFSQFEKYLTIYGKIQIYKS
jgi:hypothetical protein